LEAHGSKLSSHSLSRGLTAPVLVPVASLLPPAIVLRPRAAILDRSVGKLGSWTEQPQLHSFEPERITMPSALHWTLVDPRAQR
jgi:hypothetical protein